MKEIADLEGGYNLFCDGDFFQYDEDGDSNPSFTSKSMDVWS